MGWGRVLQLQKLRKVLQLQKLRWVLQLQKLRRVLQLQHPSHLQWMAWQQSLIGKCLLQSEVCLYDVLKASYRAVCDVLKKFNGELIRMAQDRKFRFITAKMFHDSGRAAVDTDVYDYYDEDDDVLLVVREGDGAVKYTMANVEH